MHLARLLRLDEVNRGGADGARLAASDNTIWRLDPDVLAVLEVGDPAALEDRVDLLTGSRQSGVADPDGCGMRGRCGLEAGAACPRPDRRSRYRRALSAPDVEAAAIHAALALFGGSGAARGAFRPLPGPSGAEAAQIFGVSNGLYVYRLVSNGVIPKSRRQARFALHRDDVEWVASSATVPGTRTG